jgi:hypothetical protein
MGKEKRILRHYVEMRDEFRSVGRDILEEISHMSYWAPEFIDMKECDFSSYTIYDTDWQDTLQRFHDNTHKFLSIFYAHVAHVSKNFVSDVLSLHKANDRVSYPKRLGILSKSSSILDSYVTIVSATPTPRLVEVMTSAQRDVIRKWPGFTDEELALSRDALRRYVPMWMSHPIERPKVEDPQEDKVLQEAWRVPTPEESLYLLEQGELSKGKLPLHMVFTIARQLEDSGNSDLGYNVRTNALSSIIHDLRTKEEWGNEKLFREALDEAVSGESAETGTKRVRFNYRSAFEETMVATYVRLQSGSESKNRESALDFMTVLKEALVEDTFAQSIRLSARLSDQIDVPRLLVALGEQDPDFGQKVTKELLQLKNRPILLSSEVQEIGKSLSRESVGSVQVGEDLTQRIDEILADNDAYSFAISVPKLGYNIPRGSRYGISIALDAQSQDVTAELVIERDRSVRSLPFSVDYSEVDLVCRTQLIDEDILPTTSRDELIKLVEYAIQYHLDSLRKRAPSKGVIFKARPVTTIAQPSIQIQTREERMAEYDRLKASSGRKRTGSQDASVSELPVPNGKAIERSHEFQLHIIGLDVDTISDIMTEQKIQGIDPHLIIRKLNHMMENARVSQRMIGKRINLDSVRDLPAEINLRQLNWMMDGGNNGLRVYLEDIGGGTFILRGMLNKKGFSQQQRYIGNLALRILAERRAQV